MGHNNRYGRTKFTNILRCVQELNMANVKYPKAMEKFLSCGTSVGTTVGTSIDWLNDNIKIVLVDTGAYTYSATHEFLSDITSGARISICPNLTGKTVTNGTADANDPMFTGVPGTSIE